MDLLVAGMSYLDVFVPRCTLPPPGREVFVDSISLRLGGAGNSASVAAALGLDVGLCVPQGDGIADTALGAMARELGIALLPLVAGADPAVSIVLSDPHERAFISAASFAALDQAEVLPPATWILVTGLEEAARLARPLAHARADGALVAVCGSWRPQRLAELGQLDGRPWDLLVLNEGEAEAACGSVERAPALLARAAHAVVITQGALGAFGNVGGETVHTPALPVNVVDTTGAGDAFCAGLIAALLHGAEPQAALAMGARAAGHIVQQHGGLLQEPVRIAALAKETEWKH